MPEPMSMSQRKAFYEAALACVGAPYVWQAKGSMIWTPSGLKPHDFGVPAFDCSGLVTHAYLQATGNDWRGTQNAQTLFNTLPKPSFHHGVELEFYGKSATKVSHVAIWVMDGASGSLVIEAHGGDQTTTSAVLAFERRAKVDIHFSDRKDLVGVRFI